MADNVAGVKRKKKTISDSERKRRSAEHGRQNTLTRVYLLSEYDRWNLLKAQRGLKSDREVATFLIDHYKNSHVIMDPEPSRTTSTPAKPLALKAPYVPKPSTSRATSTPRQSTQLLKPGTPEVSGVSEQESEDNGERDGEQMSGFDFLKSSSSAESCEETVVKKRSRAKAISTSFVDPFHPKDVVEMGEEVVFEEAAFGLENPDEEEIEEQEEPIGEGVWQAHTYQDCTDICKEVKCMVFMTQLKTLAKMRIDSCSKCGSKNVEMKEVFKGSAVYFKWVCQCNHVTSRWCSQPLLNRGVHSGDFLLCSTILTSGNNFGKFHLWSEMLHLKFPSAGQFHRIQNAYVVPTIDSYWNRHQAGVIDSFDDQQLVLMGDGRNDSPGHSAQYCSYTLMEHESKKILTVITIDKRATDRKSAAMEKVGLKKALDELAEKGASVTEIVTDGHLGIGAMMKTQYSHIKHSHDIWHAAKNLGKKLSKISLKAQNKILLKWNKHIVNHFWHCCQDATSYTQFVGMWTGVLHHVINEHEWVLPHGDENSYKCTHADLGEDQRDKEWLHRSKNASTLKDLASIIMEKRLLNNVSYYLNFRSTAELEGFHQHILMYCAKRFAYIPPVYRARNLLAALDHNMHAERPLLFNKDGKERLHRVYNKKSGRWNVYQQKVKKSYSYVQELLTETLVMRITSKEGMSRPRVLEESDPRNIALTLAPVQPKPSQEIFSEQMSRFKK